MYYSNSSHWYKQFLKVGGLDLKLILLGLALYLPLASVSLVLMVLSINVTSLYVLVTWKML